MYPDNDSEPLWCNGCDYPVSECRCDGNYDVWMEVRNEC